MKLTVEAEINIPHATTWYCWDSGVKCPFCGQRNYPTGKTHEIRECVICGNPYRIPWEASTG